MSVAGCKMNPAMAGTHLRSPMTLKCEYAMVMEFR